MKLRGAFFCLICLAGLGAAQMGQGVLRRVSVTIFPTAVALPVGTDQQFMARVHGARNTRVKWTVNKIAGGNPTVGVVDYLGMYTAPAAVPHPNPVTVRATSVAVPARSASASVTIEPASPPPPPGVNLTTADFFGLHMTANYWRGTNWPAVQFNAVRLWDTSTRWADMNPSNGVYNWTTLDADMAKIALKQPGTSIIILPISATPAWASSNPGNACSGGLAGGCVRPNDMNADGTGTNKHWNDFLAALAAHVSAKAFPISNYEIWNEPNEAVYWQGNNAQMVRLVKDANTVLKSILGAIQINSPCPTYAGSNSPATWLTGFFAAGGAAWVDVVDIHTYTGAGQPESEDTVIDNVWAVMNTYGPNKLWVSEGGWGRDINRPDGDEQAGFLCRLYLLEDWKNVSNFFWYSWDNSEWGTLWDSTNQIHKAGTAYGQTYNWLVGAVKPVGCSHSGTIWTCTVTRPGTYQALAVWDTSKRCSAGFCGTSNYTFPPAGGFVNYLDLAGVKHVIATGQHTVPIGYKPILLQNQ